MILHESVRFASPRAGAAGDTGDAVLKRTWTAMRQSLVLILGVSIVLVGIVMIVTPGPAFLVIPAGLAVLATEFAWARRVLDRARSAIAKRVQARKTDADSDDPGTA